MRSPPRWNCKFALGCLFVTSSVFILSLSGPPNTLLAQQDSGTQPAATPSPFQYVSSLPVCPDEVVNAVLTPSVEPTAIPSMDGPVSNCLWPSTPFPVNYDLNTIGVTGDPDPESALRDPMATPFVQPAWAGATLVTSKPVLLRQPQLYLPLLQNGADLSTVAAELSTSPAPTETIIYTDRLNHPYIPIDQLPECEDMTVDGPDYSVPDFNAPQCRVRIVASVDIKALYDQGVDLEARGLPRDPPPGSAPLITLTPVAQVVPEAVSQTTSAPAFQGQPQLYLPLLQR